METFHLIITVIVLACIFRCIDKFIEYRNKNLIVLNPKILNPLKGCTRVEVIDNSGRILVRYLRKTEKMSVSLQDDSRTIKIFIN